MNLRKLNWFVVILVLVISMACFYFGHQQWRIRIIDRPLEANIRAVAGVKDADCFSKGRETIITVELAEESSFPRVAAGLQKILNDQGSRATVNWHQKPSAGLEEVRAKLNLVLAEAQWRHEFVLMQERLEGIALEAGLSYEVDVDESNIYLSLKEGEFALYETIPLSMPREAIK